MKHSFWERNFGHVSSLTHFFFSPTLSLGLSFGETGYVCVCGGGVWCAAYWWGGSLGLEAARLAQSQPLPHALAVTQTKLVNHGKPLFPGP